MNVSCSDYNNIDKNINKVEYSMDEVKIVPLDELEEKVIIDTIKKCDGNLQLSAKLLKIGRATLYRKIKKYEINVSKWEN